MDLFAFICHSDPTKVRVGERNLAEHEVKLLKMTQGRTIPLNPPVTAASRNSADSIDKMFNEGDDANQEHLVVALDTSGVGAEKAKKRRKRKAIGGVSGSDYPPKKLRDDYQPLTPPTGGKSLFALREMVPEGSAIPSDAMGFVGTAFATPASDVGPVDSVSGLNLRTRPLHERYVISSDSSHHSDSYFEAASLVRSVADVPVVTVVVTTTADANVATGSKAKDVPKNFEHIGDSVFAGGIEVNAASISKLKKPSISSDSFYASQSLDTETLHLVYVPRRKLRAMDYDHLYSEFNVGDARQVCLGAEVRMRAEHTLEKKNELEDKCAEQANLLSERDAEIAHLRSLLSLREVEAVEAISLRGQLTVLEAADAAKGAELRDLKEKDFALEGEKNVLSEQVEALKSMAASKEVELTSLSSQVAKLTADLSGFQLSRDELNSKVASLESERDCLVTQRNSLESAFEFFKEQVEKMQDEQVGVLGDRVAAINSDFMEMALHINAEFYPRYLTTIAGRRWLLGRGLKLVLSKCLLSPEYLSAMGEAIGRAIDKCMQDGLAAGIEHGVAGRSVTDVAAYNPSAESNYVVVVNALQGVSFSLLTQLEAHKDASMADIMDLLRLECPTAETSKACPLQPSLDELMILIHLLEDQVIIGETSLAFSLEVAHNRVQWLRGDAAARRLSLTNSILPLVEPLSARSLIGEASSSVGPPTTVTTALSTTFAQACPVPTAPSTDVPPSPKVVFEEEVPPSLKIDFE
ncbi:hypothetical protein Tco_0058280, partial [Tanacetum coccineum]